ncbi:MAG: hypothetical protein LBD88_04230 [Candidatus Peribacteria bacterium]|nr:hypothetical protein [Candidatus Peribacteria bacterium]
MKCCSIHSLWEIYFPKLNSVLFLYPSIIGEDSIGKKREFKTPLNPPLSRGEIWICSLCQETPSNSPLSRGEIWICSLCQKTPSNSPLPRGEIWICSLCQKTPSNSPLSRGRF